MMRRIVVGATMLVAVAVWRPAVTAAQICRYSTWMHNESPTQCCADPTRVCPQPDNPICNQVEINRPVFDCEGEFSFFASDTAFACPCSPQGQALLAVRCNGCIAATTCEDPSCSPPPLSCDGIDDDDEPPVDPGCLDDEHGCSFLDKDPFPVRYSTGYVETNPLVLFAAPSPDGAFFGVRVVYGSHVAHLPARRPTGGTGPAIRRQDEYTHFLGHGFVDNVSDRLVIEVPGQAADTVGWVRADGVTTFNRVPSTSRYESAGGRFQLLDRGSGQAPRWVVTSTDTSLTTQVWGFEEFSIVTYGGNAGRLARLTRRSLSSSWLDITGFYGYDVAWTSDGRVDAVVDTLGRELRYVYSSVLVNGAVERWRLDTIRFVVAPTATPIDVAKFRYRVGDDLLERVERPGVPGYSRFLYFRDPPGPPTCSNCGGLLTDVIAASIAAATPAPGAPVQATETVVEHHDYELTTDGSRPRAMRSRGPGRSYAYKYTGSVTTQYDLHQTSGPCISGACGSGYACWLTADGGDQQCYVATQFEHQPATGLATRETSSTGEIIERTYGARGEPKSATDPAGVTTSYGFDTEGRVRCMVHNDDDDEAFVDPEHPDTSPCAPPTDREFQLTTMSYGPSTTTTSVDSVLATGQQASTTETRDSRGLVISQASAGWTRSLDGVLASRTRVTATSRDTLGRVTRIDGPRPNTEAFDVTDIAYWEAPLPAGREQNLGQVRTITRYVGVQGATYSLTTELDEYDHLGIPRRVVAPDGGVTTTSTSDRLSWTITRTGAGTVSVKMNPDGTVRSVVDADGVCMTYDYASGGELLASPTRIKRSSAASADCDAVPVNAATGEVEIREYAMNEPDRLTRIVRQQDGQQRYELTGLVYDTERRIVGQDSLDSPDPFVFDITHGVPTAAESPGWPNDDAWRVATELDEFARPARILRHLGASSHVDHLLEYGSAYNAMPTQLTRGQGGTSAVVTSFTYDDFGQLVEVVSPTSGTTRLDYDLAGNLIKTRVGVGSALVRTVAMTYDALGRILDVDNDVEHPVACATAPTGTAIADTEYQYDVCTGPSPAGAACANVLGRLRSVRSILHCSAGQVVKRGRWYSYDSGGRPAEVAFATVTGSSVGTPAIMTYGWTLAGKQASVTSPLNTAYGAAYTYTTSGLPSTVRRGSSTGPLLAQSITYEPFGSVSGFRGGLAVPVSGGVANLKATFGYRPDYVANSVAWSLTRDGAQPTQSYMDQTLLYAPSGLLQERRDAAVMASSRYYDYDSLLRLGCEALGSAAGYPGSQDCTTSSSRLVGTYTYWNGQSATQPPDTRAQVARRLPVESTAVASTAYAYVTGSERLASVVESGISRPFPHDALGRRTTDYRTYGYLPNGLLGQVEGAEPGGRLYDTRINYDERDRPSTISYAFYDGPPDSFAVTAGTKALPMVTGIATYELFYDDGDRLVSAEVRTHLQCVSVTIARWHFQYLGTRPIAATREVTVEPPPYVCAANKGAVAKAGSGPTITHFWYVYDERGLIQRAIDASGAEHFRAQYDAFGRASVELLADGFWMPFRLGGQLALVGTRAYSGSELVLNGPRAYDPDTGTFLSPDRADIAARAMPEAYAYARNNPLLFEDRSGENSVFGSRKPFTFKGLLFADTECSADERLKLLAGAALAFARLASCTFGPCAYVAENNLSWRTELLLNNVSCPKRGFFYSRGELAFVDDDTGMLITREADGGREVYAYTKYSDTSNATVIAPIRFDTGIECLARTLAHEALHRAYFRMHLYTVQYAFDEAAANNFSEIEQEAHVWASRDGMVRSLGAYMDDMNTVFPGFDEKYTRNQTSVCFHCPIE